MNELELKNLWQTTNSNIEKSHIINKTILIEITQLKVQNIINSMKPVKIFALIVGFIWVGIGTFVLGKIYSNSFLDANKFFMFSATIQILLTAIALLIYMYQIIEIYRIESSGPVITTQKKLAQLRLTTLWSARFLFLQLPVWTTFWWNETMLAEWNLLQWSITVSITTAFTIIAFWLFFNIKYENRNTNWFKLIFKGKEWTPLMSSMELLAQIEEYKADINANT